MKFNKEIVLTLAPYKTIKFGVTEASSWEEANKALREEINNHPEVKKLNEAEIEKAL